MTDRLYYTDPYLRRFDATVCTIDERDGRIIAVLDRTAFYPTSGGQPFDIGTLGGHPVVDVYDRDDGEIVHVLGETTRSAEASRSSETERTTRSAEASRSGETERTEREASAERPLRVGDAVTGEIDWPRRFDHMQQHTGQHVLSAAFDRVFGVRTVSFHLGTDTSTIDLAREMTPAEIATAEDAANTIVWEDRPVSVSFSSREDATAMPLRKEPKREGTLRLIDVEGWDLSACGGTHVARSGAIGIIAVASWERFKGGQRLEFLCGGRALRRFRVSRDALDASGRLLSVLPAELAAAVERLQSELKDRKRDVAALQTELARFRAVELAAAAEPVAGIKLVARALDADAAGLKSLASAITAEPGFVVALLSSSSPSLAVVARSADVAASAQQILSALIAKFGGRGGGRPELAQGGGLNGSPDEILREVRQLLG
jgi:alanyl-tRNA synthetase